MYCKNCGSEMDSAAAVCLKCGYAKGQGSGFCDKCGKEVMAGAAVCLNCGKQIESVPSIDPNTQKSKIAAGLLGIFLGGLGIHNFYLGYTGKAIGQIFASFCFGAGAVWGLIEGILILTGTCITKDANGVPLKD